MADFSDFYAASAGATAGRPSQMPQGGGSSPGVSGGFSTSVQGNVGASHIDIMGFLVLAAIALVLLHIEV